MIDLLFLTAVACIATACLLAYLLGRYHGIESTFDALRWSQESSSDWPTPLQGDVPNVPGVHRLDL